MFSRVEAFARNLFEKDILGKATREYSREEKSIIAIRRTIQYAMACVGKRSELLFRELLRLLVDL